MDKETLSNYGWIVILVLILAVMIALATPFGNFIAGAIKSTTAGFFSVNQNAMNAGGITIPGQNFDDTSSDETPVALGCDTLYWDGNTEGMESVESEPDDEGFIFEGIRYYKVSDEYVPYELLGDEIHCTWFIGENVYEPDHIENESLGPIDLAAAGLDFGGWTLQDEDGTNICFAFEEDFKMPGMSSFTKGLWFIDADYLEGTPWIRTISITIPSYTGFSHSEYCGH